MKRLFIKFIKQHTAMAVGAGISLLLLVTFLLLEYFESHVLLLESRWLVVAGVPLLSALIVGGYIKNFKGFGVELETSLSRPIDESKLTATEAMSEIKGDDKRSISYLRSLNPHERRNMSRLIMVQGRRNYYTQFALETYLRELRYLRYIEIQDASGKFLALIPVKKLKVRNEVDYDNLSDFLRHLEESSILEYYSESAITDSIYRDESIVESVRTMRKKRIKLIIVIDESNKLLGVLNLDVAENTIIENVLNANESA